MKIFEINLYDSIDERQYVQAENEIEAAEFFINNCIISDEDKTRYKQEYLKGNTENIYVEEIDIYNQKKDSIYKIEYKIDTENELQGNSYFFRAKDSDEAFEKYLIKYSEYLEEEIEEIKKDFEEGDNEIIDVYEIVVED